MKEINAEQAAAVLEPLWLEVVERFKAQGFVEPSVARLELDERVHDSCRHFGGTTLDGKRVIFAPQLAFLPVGSVEAIMAHECGHIIDLSNPGRWWYRKAGGRSQELLFQEELPSKGRKKLLDAWKEREHDEIEMVADKIAEAVMGKRIGYIGGAGCLVQCFNRGISRPTGLK